MGFLLQRMLRFGERKFHLGEDLLLEGIIVECGVGHHRLVHSA